MPIAHKVIVKAWIEKEGRYLLARRGATEVHHAGIWSLPGGNIEEEAAEGILEKTLIKEIREEVGIEVEGKMEMVYNNGFVKESDGSHVVNITFLCQWESGVARAGEDTSEIRWLTLKELEELENAPDFLVKEIKYLKKAIRR